MFVCIYMYIKLKLHKTIFGIKKLHVPLKKSILKKKTLELAKRQHIHPQVQNCMTTVFKGTVFLNTKGNQVKYCSVY